MPFFTGLARGFTGAATEERVRQQQLAERRQDREAKIFQLLAGSDNPDIAAGALAGLLEQARKPPGPGKGIFALFNDTVEGGTPQFNQLLEMVQGAGQPEVPSLGARPSPAIPPAEGGAAQLEARGEPTIGTQPPGVLPLGAEAGATFAQGALEAAPPLQEATPPVFAPRLSPQEEAFQRRAGTLQAETQFGPEPAPVGTFTNLGETFEVEGARFQQRVNNRTNQVEFVPVAGVAPPPDFPTTEFGLIALAVDPQMRGSEKAQDILDFQQRRDFGASRTRTVQETQIRNDAILEREQDTPYTVAETSQIGVPLNTTPRILAAIYGTEIIPPTIAARAKVASAELVKNRLGGISTLLDKVFGEEGVPLSQDAITRALVTVTGLVPSALGGDFLTTMAALSGQKRAQFFDILAKDADMIALKTELEALVVPLTRARGDVGNISLPEQESTRILLPLLGDGFKNPDPPEIARQKIASLISLMTDLSRVGAPGGLFPTPIGTPPPSSPSDADIARGLLPPGP